MGNTESTSDEEDMASDRIIDDTNNEVIRVFQPQKLRQELENGKSIKFQINCEIENSYVYVCHNSRTYVLSTNEKKSLNFKNFALNMCYQGRSWEF